jgi:hypothetical protein
VRIRLQNAATGLSFHDVFRASFRSDQVGTTWVEQRFYAHRVLESVFVMDFRVWTENNESVRLDGTTYLALNVTPSLPSVDVLFESIPLPFGGILCSFICCGALWFWVVMNAFYSGTEYIVFNGSTLIPETNTSSVTAVTALVSNLTNTLVFDAQVTSYTFFIVIRTSLETGKKGLC